MGIKGSSFGGRFSGRTGKEGGAHPGLRHSKVLLDLSHLRLLLPAKRTTNGSAGALRRRQRTPKLQTIKGTEHRAAAASVPSITAAATPLKGRVASVAAIPRQRV